MTSLFRENWSAEVFDSSKEYDIVLKLDQCDDFVDEERKEEVNPNELALLCGLMMMMEFRVSSFNFQPLELQLLLSHSLIKVERGRKEERTGRRSTAV